jgi:hypothetical protein
MGAERQPAPDDNLDRHRSVKGKNPAITRRGVHHGVQNKKFKTRVQNKGSTARFRTGQERGQGVLTAWIPIVCSEDDKILGIDAP